MKKKTVKKTITIKDLHKAWNLSRKHGENHMGHTASQSSLVKLMAKRLGLLPKQG